MGLGSCSLWRNKVGDWLDLVGHEFWVWSTLGAGTASLKFRQFKSAVCDAFGVVLFFWEICGGVVCFVGVCGICGLPCGVLGLRATCFWSLYCWIGGWGLVIWLGAGLLVVSYLLRTCILFTRTCTATTTGRPTWSVVFYLVCVWLPCQIWEL